MVPSPAVDAAPIELSPSLVPPWPDPGPGHGGPSPDVAAHRGRRGRPVGEWAGLAALLVVTAVAYLWDLGRQGWANSFYAAAVEAGTRSWKASFFGSLDPSNFITVDKPPASLWVMELSGRIFGFSSWSMLVPQALEGVATVALVYAVVRRWYGHRPALVAGVVMATTPVAALMFRYDNPDALLVLLLTVAAYAVTRAVERAGTGWVVAAGVALGFAFLAKMGQALLVVPGFALAYLVAAPTPLRRRLWQVLAGLAALVVSAGWWVATVALWPVADRPMIDGSPTNSIVNLILDYNGFGRVFASGGPGGGGAGGGFSGATGVLRLFNDLMGAQASWLLPAALAVVVLALAVTWRAPRTDRTRVAVLLWGGWLVVTGAVFSFGQGIIHTYYTVALAPAVAVLVGVGVGVLSGHWHRPWARLSAAAGVAATAAWAVVLLERAPQWNPWLEPTVVAAAVVAVAGILASTVLPRPGTRRAVMGAALVAVAVATLAGPAAYAAQTVDSTHTGSVPSAGPATTTGGAGAGSFPGSTAGGPPSAATGTGPGVARAGRGATSSGTVPVAGRAGGGAAGTPRALVAALESGAARYRWVAATDGSQSAASLELATGGDPVMAIGGFDGNGGNISLARFERYVAAGDIHYYIVSTGGAGGFGVAGGGVGGGVGGALDGVGGAVRVGESAGGAGRFGGAAGAGRFGGSAGGVGGASGTQARLGNGPVPGGAGRGAVRLPGRLGAVPGGAGAPGGGGGPGGAAGSDSAITSWVESHFTSRTIGGVTVYDLAGAQR